ncbi:hypothetical protein QP400_06935 [Winkia sp. UMB3158]|uniref:LPXTG-domain-containing protein cell wall anchor domain n=2 Tax=Winkia neuii TaxID=33007 RepID=K0YS82_9ACTO|nr:MULTISPECIES: hypothetical protein [Winkia]MDK8341999.1 hypothetical protein [Winkia sp. UMB3164B]OFT38962.1 hypothetical protein HMPREF3163_04130 [Actinomyces sp. HMSC08A01]PMC92694.1 hypothetical protein CJ188_09590 [Actinomyces sp. UMB0918]EJZ86637.1 hypothetical protein HMPREF9240_01011 [Winkia neuii BV029A5]MBS5946846.1 hypothetical protein [Winkia neuii]
MSALLLHHFRPLFRMVGFAALVPFLLVPSVALADESPTAEPTSSPSTSTAEYQKGTQEAGKDSPAAADGQGSKPSGEIAPKTDDKKAPGTKVASPKSHPHAPKANVKGQRAPKEITPSVDSDSLPESPATEAAGSTLAAAPSPNAAPEQADGASLATEAPGKAGNAGVSPKVLPEASSSPGPTPISPKRSHSKTDSEEGSDSENTVDHPHVILPTTSVEQATPHYFDVDLLIVGFIVLSSAGLIGLAMGMKLPNWRKGNRR